MFGGPYITLMSSLSPLGQLFSAKQTPLSRLKLESRLQMLNETDAALLQQIEDLVHWAHLPLDRTDTDIIAGAKRFFEQNHKPVLREVVASRLDLHTVVAALRRRQRGDSAPPTEPWGYGRWVNIIGQRWTEPGFGLDHSVPWVLEAHQLLKEKESVALERLLMGVVWKQLEGLGAGHYFDFEAVVIYVLRWNIIDRWTRYDGEAAVQRFRALTDASIGEFAHLFA